RFAKGGMRVLIQCVDNWVKCDQQLETFAAMLRKVTLKEIAKEAGVDVSTASRALAGNNGVHTNTRKRVLAVARELKYRPNLIAKGLVTGRSHTIGLLISDIRNPFFAEVARGAEDAAYAES